MSRLADYFVIVGYDHEKERSGISSGIILQRFPEKDWPDTAFIEGIEWFCQPQGWTLSSERQEPKFFVSVLTDIDANRHFCACLCFNETVSITPSKPADEEEDAVDSQVAFVRPIPAVSHQNIMYAPKCLVLVSRLDYIETFRNCLGVIYTVYIENIPVPLETLVGNILGCIQVPPPGGPQVRFSIGAGDRQALQPPLSPSLPVTQTSVNLLFSQLGIRNVLILFCAIMTEHKILFHSKSYNRLTEACRAMTALMYPFKYTHVYIPLLPAPLVEVLSTPTPFIMGVHSSLKSEVVELMDVILADLDGGSITIPDGISLPLLPEPLLSQTQEELSLILQPELSCADHAFPPLAVRSPQAMMLDKEIRAIFMRTFAQLLQGYRSCLTIIRIHPKPVITFHKAAFLGERNLKDCDFTTRVLDCMFFTGFVAERGPPWRPCDAWDELYNNIGEAMKLETLDNSRILSHIQELAQQLYTNENPNPQSYAQKILVPPEGAFARIHQPSLPQLNVDLVRSIIEEGLSKNNLKSRLASLRPIQPRIVPMGPCISNLSGNKILVSNSARRLEVLRNCINCIFENKITDARKTFPAVLRALQSKQARLALCAELAQHVSGNKAMLEHQQFDLVARLMNCALQDDSAMDEYGVAAALLPLATIFGRKLCTGIIQFAYTCIQDHPVWQNQQFWEAAFYQDVQKDIKALYTSTSCDAANVSPSNHYSMINESVYPKPTSPRDTNNEYTWQQQQNRRSTLMLVKSQEATSLEIAAEQMRLWNAMDAEKRKELITQEENTIYSQAIHYANRMVYLLIPLDVGSKVHHKQDAADDDRASNSVTNSVAESDSVDAESGFEDQETVETGANVIRSVSRFVDKVCNEGGVTRDHIRNLHQMIPGVVHMHIETLEAVHRESKRLPPIQKPKILAPNLLPGEEVVMEGLRVYLLPDGREESGGGAGAGPPLLPAEGAIFLTNYRIIFKGIPCDSFACEQVVVRAFPVTSLTKEKKIAIQYLAHLDQWLQEGLQIRSCTFQLMKLAFDEEVTAENVDMLRKLMHKIRHPPDVFHHFAFAGQVMVNQTPLHKSKEKNATLLGISKKTLLKTARKAGFKQKASSKRQKYVLPNLGGGASSVANKYLTSPGRMTLPLDALEFENRHESVDDMSSNNYDGTMGGVGGGRGGSSSSANNGQNAGQGGSILATDAKTLERLRERSYVRDWRRMGLTDGGIMGGSSPVGGGAGRSFQQQQQQQQHQMAMGFRVTSVNSMYMMCRSYPALLVVPSHVTDDSVRRFARCYRQNRIPAVTWRHPKTGALLLRGAAHHNKGAMMMGMLKGGHHHAHHPHHHHHHQGNQNASETTSAIEQEKYLAALVAATPLFAANKRYGAGYAGMSDSSLSINSLLLAADEKLGLTLTPEVTRRSNPFNKAMGTLGVFQRSSGGKGAKHFGRWGSLKDKRHSSQASLSNAGGVPPPSSSSHHPSNHRHSTLMTSHRAMGATANDGRCDDPSDAAGGAGAVHCLQKSALYVLGEKAQMKGVKYEATPKTDFIPVEYYDVRRAKQAFKKLMRACVPSAATAAQGGEPDQTFYRLIENSEWLQQIQNIMQLAGAVVDLLDVQGSSVAICLEDGWDITAQVASVAQICLDPYYRTIEGFRVLIEKEWIGFGHRFSHRSNLNSTSQTSGFAPTFLQFLDVVHQIQTQFPMAFEFNERYLRFLAYHSVSCRFRTFLFDCELERAECGVAAVEDKRGSLTSHHKHVVDGAGSDEEGVTFPGMGGVRVGGATGIGGGASSSSSSLLLMGTTSSGGGSSGVGGYLGQSVFDYAEKQHARTPIFFNFMYMADLENPVLRPQSHLPCLDVWDYYLNEDLRRGPSYDPEIAQMDSQQEEEAEAADGDLETSSRKVVTFGYDCVNHCVPDAFSHLLEETHRLETELGHLPQKWKVLWDKLEINASDSLARHASFSTDLVRSHGRLVHKRSTLEILMRGKMATAAEASLVYSHPHRFDKYNYTTPTYCDYCTNLLWGPVKTGMRCMDCGYSCHEKCIEGVPKNCTKYKTADSGTPQTMNVSNSDNNSVSSGSARQTSSQQYYEQFSSNVAENRTHEGYLYKRGALLKGWKQRWFVLDSIKHQLRYYDAMEDSHCKGYIDLGEVMSVTPAAAAPGPPKKTDDKSFFDLRTSRRTYNFCAPDATYAQEWIEKLQACLQ